MVCDVVCVRIINIKVSVALVGDEGALEYRELLISL
jgi:hypothetical protein